MKDRVLLVLAGLACAGVAQVMWSKLPTVTFGLILLALVANYLQDQRIKRVKIADRERVAQARARQLARLARTLAAVRDSRRKN